MRPVTGAVWRKRMQDLSRNVGLPHAPLFVPLTLAAAAQIEAIPVAQMVCDATRLRKNITEMRRMLGLQAAVCAVPSAMEIEAVGAVLSTEVDVWPPRVVDAARVSLGEIDPAVVRTSPRIAASLEAVRQLAAADTEEPVLIVALTGPATVLAQLRGAGVETDGESGYECVGRLLATLARLYAEAGAHVLHWHESVLPQEDDVDFWKGALGTAGNIARFHRIPALLVISSDTEAPQWPAQAIACPTYAQHAGTMPRAHGRTWSADLGNWPHRSGNVAASERYVTTASDLPGDILVAALRARVEQALANA